MTDRLRASDLHPELRAFRFVPNPPIHRPWVLSLAQRPGPSRRGPKLPVGMDYRFVDLGDGVAAHVYSPAGDAQRAAVMWIHGGGMVVGSAAQDHARCLALAGDLDVVVVSDEYRLATAHGFPIPLDDCHRVWRWLVDHAAELHVDVDRLAIGGQSAGGGLTAGLVLRVHDEGGTQPVAQWLFCPMLDDRTAANRELDAVRHYLWNNTSNRVGWSAYLGGDPGGPDVPAYAAPARRTDLAGLPAAWVGCGDIDLFHDEDVAYAQALIAAGVPCEVDTVAGAPHAFESILPKAPVSRAYSARARSWLAEQLAPS